MKKFFLTTPIYYANARPHVGSAYTTIVCDAIARYKRQCGYEVAYLTGTDEHGEKLERAAAAKGMDPQAFVDVQFKLFPDLWERLDVECTHFIRTTREDHVRSVHKMIERATKKGLIYKGEYQGRYCVHDELYVSDSAEPADCPTCGRPAELRTEENYFFKLSAFQDRLLRLYEEQPDFVQPDFRRNEVISFVKSGLRDISVSRSKLKWGIPWPGDAAHVVYVWYDALTSYLTGIGFAEGQDGSQEFQKYWPADVHMMAKEIVRFHAVYWPAFLLAADLPLPKQVFAHGWLLFEQDKMSKSKGNVVYCEPIVEVLGADALRYYLLRDMTFGQDSSFSYDGLVQRYNSDLANDLGNLGNRTVNMVQRYFGGVTPAAPESATLTSAEQEIAELSGETLAEFRARMEIYDFSRALEAIWQFIGRVNKYLVETEPWTMAESGLPENRERVAAILYTAAQAVRFCAVVLSPFMPQSAQRLWRQLGGEGEAKLCKLDELVWGELKAGTRLPPPQIIFPRVEKEAAIQKIRQLAASETAASKKTEARPAPKETSKPVSTQPPSPTGAPAPDKITIEEFAKVDMRVGTVLTAERVAGANKLLKLTVDIGSEVRQVLAGIAEAYQPEQLLGMKVVIVANLQPRKLRGLESNGMIVAATVEPSGRPVLVTFKEEVPNGARLK